MKISIEVRKCLIDIISKIDKADKAAKEENSKK